MTAAARVLLVDDDERLRQVLARALAVRGYEVIEASNIPAALAALGGPITLIVTDLDVNDRSGMELVAAVNAGGDRRPVIVMSGPRGASARDAVAAHPGVTALLEKPFSIDALVVALTQALADR